MNRALTLLMFAALLPACSKKEPALEPIQAPALDPAAEAKGVRSKAIATLRKERNSDAAWKLAELSDEDPEVVPALVELLRDKANAGLGRRLPEQYSSVREAAAQALVMCGEPGIAALNSKGFDILHEGLKDTTPAVREHTILTIVSLKDRGKPLAGDVAKLCADGEEKVRGAAFDALGTLGVPEPLEVIVLLNHPDAGVRRLAAETVQTLDSVPDAALEPLLKTLEAKDPVTSRAAAHALGLLGPKAAKAVPLALAAIRASADKGERSQDVDGWLLLSRIGTPAVPELVRLVDDREPIQQLYAIQALGMIGPEAKDAAAALKKRLTDPTAELAIAAAVALCRIGVHEAEATSAIGMMIKSENDDLAAAAIETVPYLRKPGLALVPAALAKAESPMPRTRAAALALAVRLGAEGIPAAAALGKAVESETDIPARLEYARALANMGPAAKAALDSLVKVAGGDQEPENLRRAAVLASVAVAPDSPKAIEAAKSLVGSSRAEDRAVAATAMGRLKPLPPEVATDLANLMKKDRSVVVRRAAAESLALATPPAKNVKTELEAAACGKDDVAYWARLAVAGFDGDTKALEPVVREGLKNKRPEVHAAALACLPRLGTPGKDDLAMLVKDLQSNNDAVRITAARVLGQFGPASKKAVVPLSRMAVSRDPTAQLAALEALVAIGPDAAPAIPRLRSLLNRDDPEIVRAAQLTIERLRSFEPDTK